MSQLLAAMQL